MKNKLMIKTGIIKFVDIDQLFEKVNLNQPIEIKMELFNGKDPASIAIDSDAEMGVFDFSQLDSYCKLVCKNWSKIYYMIKMVTGEDGSFNLLQLLLQGKSKQVQSQLDNIYWNLPDEPFNIKERPSGFIEFLSLVEDRFDTINNKVEKFEKLPSIIKAIHRIALESRLIEVNLDYYPSDWGPALRSHITTITDGEPKDDFSWLFSMRAQNTPHIEYNPVANQLRVKGDLGWFQTNEKDLPLVILTCFQDIKNELARLNHSAESSVMQYLDWVISELTKLI